MAETTFAPTIGDPKELSRTEASGRATDVERSFVGKAIESFGDLGSKALGALGDDMLSEGIAADVNNARDLAFKDFEAFSAKGQTAYAGKGSTANNAYQMRLKAEVIKLEAKYPGAITELEAAKKAFKVQPRQDLIAEQQRTQQASETVIRQEAVSNGVVAIGPDGVFDLKQSTVNLQEYYVIEERAAKAFSEARQAGISKTDTDKLGALYMKNFVTYSNQLGTSFDKDVRADFNAGMAGLKGVSEIPQEFVDKTLLAINLWQIKAENNPFNGEDAIHYKAQIDAKADLFRQVLTSSKDPKGVSDTLTQLNTITEQLNIKDFAKFAPSLKRVVDALPPELAKVVLSETALKAGIDSTQFELEMRTFTLLSDVGADGNLGGMGGTGEGGEPTPVELKTSVEQGMSFNQLIIDNNLRLTDDNIAAFYYHNAGIAKAHLSGGFTEDNYAQIAKQFSSPVFKGMLERLTLKQQSQLGGLGFQMYSGALDKGIMQAIGKEAVTGVTYDDTGATGKLVLNSYLTEGEGGPRSNAIQKDQTDANKLLEDMVYYSQFTALKGMDRRVRREVLGRSIAILNPVTERTTAMTAGQKQTIKNKIAEGLEWAAKNVSEDDLNDVTSLLGRADEALNRRSVRRDGKQVVTMDMPTRIPFVPLGGPPPSSEAVPPTSGDDLRTAVKDLERALQHTAKGSPLEKELKAQLSGTQEALMSPINTEVQ